MPSIDAIRSTKPRLRPVLREYVWDDDVPVAQASAGPIVYLHTDHLGTPRLGTNSVGAEVWRWDSDAFGTTAPAGSAVVNLRFPGQYFDAETGLHYNWHRTYDPASGRYVESDPIGLAGGLNTFGYVGGNPNGYGDPAGLFIVNPVTIGAVIGGVSGAIQAGTAVGWSWKNWKEIATGTAAGAAFGAIGGVSVGTGLRAFTSGLWVGGAAGFAGNAASQYSLLRKENRSLSCINWKQAFVQGWVGGTSAFMAGPAYGPFPVKRSGTIGAVLSGLAATGINYVLPTDLGGFHESNH